jgi:phospholipase D1/2
MLGPPSAHDAEHSPPLSKAQRVVALVALALLLALSVYLLRQATNPHSAVRHTLTALIERVRDPKLGLLYVLLTFGLGTLAFAPVTLLMGATALVLGPVLGFAYGMLGALFGCSISYWLGRLLGGNVVVRLGGHRLVKLRTLVHARSFRAVLIARFLPIGNFTLINLFLGSLRVRYAPYMLANVVGVTPALLAFTLLSEQLQEAIQAPSVMSIGRLALIALALLLAAWIFARWMRQKATRDSAEA